LVRKALRPWPTGSDEDVEHIEKRLAAFRDFLEDLPVFSQVAFNQFHK